VQSMKGGLYRERKGRGVKREKGGSRSKKVGKKRTPREGAKNDSPQETRKWTSRIIRQEKQQNSDTVGKNDEPGAENQERGKKSGRGGKTNLLFSPPVLGQKEATLSPSKIC